VASDDALCTYGSHQRGARLVVQIDEHRALLGLVRGIVRLRLPEDQVVCGIWACAYAAPVRTTATRAEGPFVGLFPARISCGLTIRRRGRAAEHFPTGGLSGYSPPRPCTKRVTCRECVIGCDSHEGAIQWK
jgi:hypothetical protein